MCGRVEQVDGGARPKVGGGWKAKGSEAEWGFV